MTGVFLAALFLGHDTLLVPTPVGTMPSGEKQRPITSLIAELLSPSPDVRRDACRRLGGRRDARAVDALIVALQDPRPKVRVEAATGLSRCGDGRAFGPLLEAMRDDYLDVQRAAGHAAGVLGHEHVDRLIRLLKQWEDRDRMVAAIALGPAGSRKAVDPLIQALRDPSSEVKEAAAEALGRLRSRRAIGPLVANLKSGPGFPPQGWDSEVAHREVLVRIGKPAVPALIRALQDPDPLARRVAAEALGSIGDRRALKPLIAALNDEEEETRTAAAESLKQLHDPLAIVPLEKALRAPPRENEFLMARWELWVMAKALGSIGGRGVPVLLEALHDRRPELREAGAVGLGVSADERAVGPLAEAACKDPDPHVRYSAACSLGELGPMGLPELLRMLRDQDSAVREYAALGLGGTKDRQAVGPLVNALDRDTDSGVRFLAARALGKLGDGRAVPSLIASLEDKSDTVREYSARSLGQLADRRAVQPLAEMLRRDEDLNCRYAAIKALMVLPDPRVPQILAAEIRTSPEWMSLWDFLVPFGSTAVPFLLKALEDSRPAVRAGVAKALGKIADDRASSALRSLRGDPDPRVRKAAGEALAEIGVWPTQDAARRLRRLMEADEP